MELRFLLEYQLVFQPTKRKAKFMQTAELVLAALAGEVNVAQDLAAAAMENLVVLENVAQDSDVLVVAANVVRVSGVEAQEVLMVLANAVRASDALVEEVSVELALVVVGGNYAQ